MSTMPSVGSGTYSPGPNMVCSPQQEKVGTGSIEARTCPVYIDLRIRATVSMRCSTYPFHCYTNPTPWRTEKKPLCAHEERLAAYHHGGDVGHTRLSR